MSAPAARRPREGVNPSPTKQGVILWALLLALPVALGGCPQPAPPPAAKGPRPSLATASPALAELVCALGAREHLVGVSRFCVFPKELDRLPRIGGVLDPNLEAIDALAPDIVLLQANDEKVSALAARRGFRVESFRIENFAEWFLAVERLGVLLGLTEEAKREAQRLSQALESARARRPARAPRTLIVFMHRPGVLGLVSSPGSGTFVAECLEVAGGVSCLEDLPPAGWHRVSKEALLERAPDLIIELNTEPVSASKAKALREDWQILSDIPAVKNGRIAIISGDELLIPGARLDRLVEKLSRAVGGDLDVR